MKDKDKKVLGGIGLLAMLALMLGMGGKRPPIVPGPSLDPDDDDDDDEPSGPGGFTPGPAYPDEPEPPLTPTPAEPGFDPVKIVNKYLCPSPCDRTGALYLIQEGDNPPEVAKAALGVGTGHKAIAPYVVAMAEASMNFALYDVIWTPDEGTKAGGGQPGVAGAGDSQASVYRRYTAKLYDPDDGKIRRWYIGDAFFRHHRLVLGMLRAGQLPERSTDKWGNVYASRGHYGLIWLPRAHLDQSGNLVVDDLDPPEDLQSLMTNIYEV